MICSFHILLYEPDEITNYYRDAKDISTIKHLVLDVPYSFLLSLKRSRTLSVFTGHYNYESKVSCISVDDRKSQVRRDDKKQLRTYSEVLE